mmetsp:Transcript_9400/g.19820  ORF Transcript_9400/g.19820 Transcript_9400/m.19820 type:complete len:328 (-) Transcript_9400:306-1289(-)
MKKVVVFEEPLSRRYATPRLSFTYLVIVLSNSFALMVPFYFCTGTEGDFWLKNDTYRETPDIKFLYKFIMVLETASPTSDKTNEIFVSTMDSLNVLRPETYRMANVMFHEDDADLDGMFDSFTLDATVPLAKDEKIMSMQALLFFNFRLQKRVKFDMESVAYTSFDSGIPISRFDTTGSLMLRQTSPFGVRKYFSALYTEDTPLVDVIELSSTNRITDANIGNILEEYRERDIATDYVERYPIKYRALDTGENGTFRIEMKMDISEQEVLYIPTLVEVLKDAWVKYLSVVVLCWFLIKRIKSFAFSQNLLRSSVSSNHHPAMNSQLF